MGKQKRKSPVRHRVKAHKRQSRPVRSFFRGRGTLASTMKVHKVRTVKVRELKERMLQIQIELEKYRRGKKWDKKGEDLVLEATELADKISRLGEEPYPPRDERLTEKWLEGKEGRKFETKSKTIVPSKKNYVERTKGYRLQSGKLRLYASTGKTADRISTRNRRIITILMAEGPTSSKELSRRLGLREQTILVELEYLEKRDFVKRVKQ